jgi:hypothetical protein
MSAFSVLIVEKSGTIRETAIKSFSEADLYKKAGFKTSDDFQLKHVWNVNLEDTKYCIHLYGKEKGRAGMENKYEFPPPVDNVLFFGSCVLVNKDVATNEVTRLSEKEWEAIYDFLYGGFDDIGDEESACSRDEYDETEIAQGLKITKAGYIKDGFVVDDEELEDVSVNSSDEEDVEEDEIDEDFGEDEFVVNKKKPKTALPFVSSGGMLSKSSSSKKNAASSGAVSNKKPPIKNSSSSQLSASAAIYPIDAFISSTATEDAEYLGCTSELEEEEYFD